MKRNSGSADLTFGVFNTGSTSATPDHVFTVSGVSDMGDLTTSYVEYTATGSCVMAENDGEGFVQTNASSADMNTDCILNVFRNIIHCININFFIIII